MRMDLMKLSIPFVMACLSSSLACSTRLSKKADVDASFQVSMIACMTSLSLRVVKLRIVKRMSGRIVITGETWKVISLEDVTIRTYTTNFYLSNACTDTGVIVTHAFIFLPALGHIVSLTHAQLTVVTQSCALLYIAAHCDLLLQ